MHANANKAHAAESTRSERRFSLPSVDITESKDEYVLEADMPGVTKENLEVLLEGNDLTIIGRRSPRPSFPGLHVESSTADFRRAFVLDPVIDTSRVTAQIDQGVLRVRLPKAEAVKPRKVNVTD